MDRSGLNPATASSVPVGSSGGAAPIAREGAPALVERYRDPFDWDRLLDFLGPRCVAGIEEVADRGGARLYRRVVASAAGPAVLEVRNDAARRALVLEAGGEGTSRIELPSGVGARVRALFDLDHDPASLQHLFAESSLLAPRVAAAPGLRVPGCWEPFELLVRAILGQQVTVAGASTLAARLVERWGRSVETGDRSLAWSFPEPAVLAQAPVEEIGLPRRRAACLRDAAQRFLSSSFRAATPAEQRAALLDVPGIGPWTVEYFALRAQGDRDAFPAGDLWLRRVVDPGRTVTEKQLSRRADAWRPLRGYAALLLWQVEAAAARLSR